MERVYEIITRGTNGIQVLEQSELEYVVEKYIYIRTAKEVKINLIKGIPRELIPLMFTNEMQKLDMAFSSACKWLMSNQDKWIEN